MPDIAMCPGGTCPIKDRCYRFTAKPKSDAQSYFDRPPYGKVEERECKFFMPTKTEVEDGLKS